FGHVLQHFDVGPDTLGLNRTAGWRVKARGGQAHHAASGAKRKDRLNGAPGGRASADDRRSLVVLQRTSHDFRGCGRTGVAQDHDASAVSGVAPLGTEALRVLRTTPPQCDDFTAIEQLIRYGNRLVQQPAGIIAQVDNISFEAPVTDLSGNIAQRSPEGLCRLFVELGDAYV